MCSASEEAIMGAASLEELKEGAAEATHASDSAKRPLILNEQTVMERKAR